jgi:hypothetical protein
MKGCLKALTVAAFVATVMSSGDSTESVTIDRIITISVRKYTNRWSTLIYSIKMCTNHCSRIDAIVPTESGQIGINPPDPSAMYELLFFYLFNFASKWLLSLICIVRDLLEPIPNTSQILGPLPA